MRTMLSRIFLALFIGGALALVVFGKRPDSFRLPDGRDVRGRVVVTYWEKWSNAEARAMQDVVDAYNLSQNRVYVNFVSMSQINQKLLIATAGGDPPDIAGTFASQVAPCAANGTILPLVDLQRSGVISEERYKPFVWDICAPDGKTAYAAGATPVVNALYYNKEMFGAAEISPPGTMEEMDAAAERLTVRNASGEIQRLGFLPTEPGWYDYDYGVYFGNDLYDREHDTFAIRSAANVAAYAWYQGYAARYGAKNLNAFRAGFGDFNSPANGFICGKLAMVIQGPYFAAFIARNNPGLRYGVVAVPLAAGKAGDRVLADLDVWVVPRGAKHRAEAMEAIAFFSRQQELEELCGKHGKPSPLREVSTSFLQGHPNPYIGLFEGLCLSPGVQTLPGSPVWERARAQLDQSTAAIWTGADVKESLETAQRTVDGFVAEQRHNDAVRRAAGGK